MHRILFLTNSVLKRLSNSIVPPKLDSACCGNELEREVKAGHNSEELAYFIEAAGTTILHFPAMFFLRLIIINRSCEKAGNMKTLYQQEG